eukprot:7376721-Prymnesium_polylepis.1
METQGGVQLIKVLHEKEQLRVAGLIGDADSSLMKAISELPDHLKQVEKELDVGHVKGNLYGALKAMGGGILSDPTVNYQPDLRLRLRRLPGWGRCAEAHRKRLARGGPCIQQEP